MCQDSDLFGDIIVLKSDVKLWLSEVARLDETTPESRKEQYYNNYDLANIIKKAKSSGFFYVVKSQHEAAANNHQQQPTWLYPTKYIENPPPVVLPCPPHFHICENDRCHIFIKRMAREKSRAAYLKRKALRKKGRG